MLHDRPTSDEDSSSDDGAGFSDDDDLDDVSVIADTQGNPEEDAIQVLTPLYMCHQSASHVHQSLSK